MFKKIVLIALFCINSYALVEIKKTYYIDSRDINSSLFFKDKKEVKLYTIPKHKHSLRIRDDQLQKLLKDKGFNNFSIKPRFIYFELKSPIDTTKIENFLKDHYKAKYEKIKINKVLVQPRTYMQSLPTNYTIEFRNRSHLSNEGVLSIEDNSKRKYFFNYMVDADIDALKAKKKILRGEEISNINSVVESVKLDDFRSIPLQRLDTSEFQAKYHINKGEMISRRDVRKLDLVREDTQVSVSMENSSFAITFSATALQSGKLNDIITIQKRDGRKLKAKVIGKQRVEIR
jgi:flagella basal body P-ring formation protein FlgA